MARVSMSAGLKASPDAVWRLIGGFNALADWHPMVERSALSEEGRIRTLFLDGGGTIIERQEHRDEEARTYSYSIVEAPMAIANYHATIKVSGAGDSCTIEWSSAFEPVGMSEQEAVEAIRDVYAAGLDNLRKIFGGS